MPRGVYPRKKRFPARSLQQVRLLQYPQPKEKDTRLKVHIDLIITHIHSQLNLLKDLING